MQPLYPLPAAPLSRRGFLRASSSLAAAALWSGCASGPVRRGVAFPAFHFSLGVASGDPVPDGFVLWTRLAPKPLEGGGMPAMGVEVSWIVAEDERLTKVVQKGRQIARPEWGHSVHVEVNGLQPERWYWYQFKTGSDVSPLGRTRTTPAPGSSSEKFRFAFASCQHYETGFFNAYEHMIQENLDLVVHLGDYIYEDAGREKQVRRHVGKEAIMWARKRSRWRITETAMLNTKRIWRCKRFTPLFHGS
jgi:alkaline phosphatase D